MNEQENIEIVYLSEDKEEQNVKQKEKNTKHKYILLGAVLLSFVIFLTCTFIVVKFIMNFNFKSDKYKNVIGKKNIIETTLDLEGIFDYDDNLSSMYNINNLEKAIIHNDKIYYSYSPAYCYNSSLFTEEITCDQIDTLKEMCKNSQERLCKDSNNNSTLCDENYCEDTYSNLECSDELEIPGLCKNYYTNDTEYEDLLYRYVMVSNLDGTNTKELKSHQVLNPIIFDYKDSNLAYYYSMTDDSTYKLNFKNDKVTNVKEEAQVVPYPISNEKETVLINFDKNLYTLNYYPYDNFSKTTKKLKIYNDSSTSYTIRLDKYVEGDIYTISYPQYDEDLTENSLGVYKNGELVYEIYRETASKQITLEDYFVTDNFIYLLITQENKLKAIKIDKKTYIEEEQITLFKEKKSSIKYIATGNDDLVYLSIDNTIYTFDEKNDKLNETGITFHNVKELGTYNNFIYFYGDTDKFKHEISDLVFYNTETKTKTVIENVKYFTIDNGKLYTVTQDDTFELNYYEID